jgi:hypothetical protein
MPPIRISSDSSKERANVCVPLEARIVDLSLGTAAGLVAQSGRPRIHEVTELVRGYLQTHRKHTGPPSGSGSQADPPLSRTVRPAGNERRDGC